MSDLAFATYQFSALLNQVIATPCYLGRQITRYGFRIAMSPARIAVAPSDLYRSRDLFLGNTPIDSRTVRSETEIPIPAISNGERIPLMFHAGLQVGSWKGDTIARGSLGKWIWVDLGASWRPAHLAIDWAEEAGIASHRIAMRSAPRAGNCNSDKCEIHPPHIRLITQYEIPSRHRRSMQW